MSLLRKIALPDDVTDAERFPNIARSQREWLAKPAEERARLEAEWNGAWQAMCDDEWDKEEGR